MQPDEIQALLRAQRDYYHSGATLPLKTRISALKALQTRIREGQEEILAALKQDLGKSSFEGYMCEVGMALDEIRYVLKRLKKWAKPRRVKTPLAQFAA